MFQNTGKKKFIIRNFGEGKDKNRNYINKFNLSKNVILRVQKEHI